MRVGYNAMYE